MGFDEYDRKARLTPGLLIVAPIAIVVVTLGLKSYPAVAALSGIVVATGGTYVLAILVRSLGRGTEAELWLSWGGPPTSTQLRLRSSATNPVLRDQWRAAVARVSGVTLLPHAAEIADPTTADHTIEAAVARILRFGQDDRYPLVKKENIQYGFARNLYAVRFFGRAISTVCVLVLIAAALAPHAFGASSGSAIAGLTIDAGFLLGWLVIPSADRAKEAAGRYAKELLQATTNESQAMDEAK